MSYITVYAPTLLTFRECSRTHGVSSTKLIQRYVWDMRVSTCVLCDGAHTACMYVCAVLMSNGSFSICGPTPVKSMHAVVAEIADTVFCSLGFWKSLPLRKMQMLRCVQKDALRI